MEATLHTYLSPAHAVGRHCLRAANHELATQRHQAAGEELKGHDGEAEDILEAREAVRGISLRAGSFR